MQFNSAAFFIFFPVTVLVYFLLPKKAKSLWLLAASYYFYMQWNPVYVFLLFGSTLLTYICGIGMEKTPPQKRKILLLLAVTINILMLGYFKYLSFLADSVLSSVNKLFSTSYEHHLDILLPVGISFFIFQSIGYTADVYRGRIKAEKNFVRYALFVSFFPQLVAGPIERSSNLLPQIRSLDHKRIWSLDGIIRGFILMVWGMFLKVVLADRLAIIVDNAFANYQNYETFSLFTGAAAFSLQIYCDFAGYSTIAVGAAKVIGIDLMENFNTPYFSCSIKEFWNRWHISLSSWLKDYVYFPLGGSRCSKARHYCNLLVTFLASGIWHGAGWNYIFWGLLHGFYQIAERILEPLRKKFNTVLDVNETAASHRLFQGAVTFLLTTVAWIFFRADSLNHAFAYLERMLHPNLKFFLKEALPGFAGNTKEMRSLVIGLVLLLLVSILRRIGYKLDDFFMKQGMLFRIFSLLVLIILIIKYGTYGEHVYTAPFVYFQF